jgi:hypothetical protein
MPDRACCDSYLRPFNFTAAWGDERQCPQCGRSYVHVCDEAEGCFWEPLEEGPVRMTLPEQSDAR